MAKKFLFIISIVLVFILSVDSFSQQKMQQVLNKNGNVKYLSNEVIVKLRYIPSADLKGIVSLPSFLKTALAGYKVTSGSLLFQSLRAKSEESNLTRIISIKYDSDIDPMTLSSKLRMNKDIEWIEPRFIYETEYIPNDPRVSEQWALTKIQAFDAWNYAQGDSTIIIGIVDTGVQWDHNDLVNNIWINNNEIPDNGIDDDNNGFVDDYIGWDFGGFSGVADNNPAEDNPDHGTHVAGIAAATANNSTGIAGVGFKCKIMPVKTTQNNYRNPSGQPYIIFGYEGIQYAAQNGAKIINCSWGGGGYSQLGQDVFNYAASLGAVVICAAGNESYGGTHYPSDFDNSFSVAATGTDDSKAGYSNYGKMIGVSAPGSSILSTWMTDTMATLSGTSMATPLVSGLAGVVKSRFPNYTYEQVLQQIRVTTDNIDYINPSYTKLLGTGRVNAFKAVTVSDAKSARITKFIVSDAVTGNNNGVIEPGETFTIEIIGKNFLSPTSNLSVTLVSTGNYATVLNGVLQAGAVATLGQFNNSSNKFTVQLAANCPDDTELPFQLQFSDGSYSDFQWIAAIGNPSYATQSINKVSLTVASTGELGFVDYPTNVRGTGLIYNDEGNILFEGGLMFGTSPVKISSAVRGPIYNLQDQDFDKVLGFTILHPGPIADGEGKCKMVEKSTATSTGVSIDLHTYSYMGANDNRYMILRYRFTNTTSSAITAFYAGLFLDFDMTDGTYDKIEYVPSGNYGKVYHILGAEQLTQAAVGLISDNNYQFYPITNDGTMGGINVYDGFSKPEKFTTLSSGIAAQTSGSGDVSMVVGSGPMDIPLGGYKEVAFAIAGGLTTADLTESINNARIKYQYIATSIEKEIENESKSYNLSQNFPNPILNNKTTITYNVVQSGKVVIKLYDILGKEIKTVVNSDKEIGIYSEEIDVSTLSSGIYFYSLWVNNFNSVKKMVVAK